MIDQSTGCDFGEDDYIAIRLCGDFHDEMTKNSRNRNSNGKMYIIVEEKIHIACLSLFFSSSFMCQYSKVVGNNRLSIGIHRYLVTAIPPVISFLFERNPVHD